jgi:catechol 2,3-dioxygenase-like lactoylglutathione lyase family enzyme
MESQVKLKAIAPQFVVPDVVKTAEYYRDQLGFKILGYFADPPVYAMVARDGVEIHFGRADSEGVQVNESIRKGSGNDAYIWVTDINALFEELSGRDVKILEGPVKRIYESTEVVIRDCDGHQLVFAD